MKRSVIIVAGGSGTRMGVELPKQYLGLAGKPMIVHTLEKFLHFDPAIEVVVVLDPSHQQHWDIIRAQYAPAKQFAVAQGGASRFDSVKNGLAHVQDGRVVGIHDAVRPLVSQGTIERTYSAAVRWGSGIPVVSMEDSVRLLDGEKGSTGVDRTRLRRVQTPQVFLSERLREAYQHAGHSEFTDDASVYESHFGQVYLVEGNRENIKITTPSDLKLAGALIQMPG